MPPTLRKPERFVWPPRPPDTPDRPGKEPPRPQTRENAPSPWRVFEREILGLVDAPPDEQLAEADWVADSPDAYCNRCGSTTGPHEATPPIDLEDLALAEGFDPTAGASCPACRNKRLAWHRAVRLGEYRGLLRELIHDLKFQRRRAAGVALGKRLGLAVRKSMEDSGIDPARAVVVPVPMSFRRRWSRGVDHARTLARQVAIELQCPLVATLRRRHRPTQWTVPASRRRANIRGAFRASPRALRRLEGRVLVVVDDIRTTGATLTECCSAILKSSGKRRPDSVWVAVVAVTPRDGHLAAW